MASYFVATFRLAPIAVYMTDSQRAAATLRSSVCERALRRRQNRLFAIGGRRPIDGITAAADAQHAACLQRRRPSRPSPSSQFLSKNCVAARALNNI
jgi:hypothetical protein